MHVGRMRTIAPVLLAGSLLASAGCGDIGRVVLDVDFASEDLELRTRSLEVVVRESAPSAMGCARLWDTTPSGLAEDRQVIPYPNRVDVRASPVDLDRYPVLTLLVYAFPSAEGPDTSSPVAGGCTELTVDPAASTELNVQLEAAP